VEEPAVGRQVPRAVPRATVASAAAEVSARATRPAAEPEGVEGPLPAEASSTGRRYYAFTAPRWEVPFIACGQATALHYLEGSWLRFGRAPRGFAQLEDAINFVALERGAAECLVRWA
jgi:hypothetical protein